MKRIHSLIAAAALVASVPAQAEDASIVFRHSGNWTADYGDDYCRLIRTFTDGTRTMSLALERLQPGGLVRLIIVGEGMRPYRGADQITSQFLPSGNLEKLGFARAETIDGKAYFSFDPVVLPPASGATAMYSRELEQEAARGITGILLTEGLTSPIRVETGSLGAAIGALQDCADDLLTVWGLDAEKHKTMSAMPVLNPNPDGVLPPGTVSFTGVSRSGARPNQGRLLIGSGSNLVRLLVGADGLVTSCAIYSPSLSAALNERICSLVQERASFQPARDAGGQPMASVWIGSPMVFSRQFGGAGQFASAGWGNPAELAAPVTTTLASPTIGACCGDFPSMPSPVTR